MKLTPIYRLPTDNNLDWIDRFEARGWFVRNKCKVKWKDVVGYCDGIHVIPLYAFEEAPEDIEIVDSVYFDDKVVI